MTPDTMTDAFTRWAADTGRLDRSNEQQVTDMAAAFMAGCMHTVRARGGMVTHREVIGPVTAGQEAEIQHGARQVVLVEFFDRATGNRLFPPPMMEFRPNVLWVRFAGEWTDVVATVFG